MHTLLIFGYYEDQLKAPPTYSNLDPRMALGIFLKPSSYSLFGTIFIKTQNYNCYSDPHCSFSLKSSSQRLVEQSLHLGYSQPSIFTLSLTNNKES